MTLREDIQQQISRLVQMFHQHHESETLPADTQAHIQALRSSVGEPDMLAPDADDPESTQGETALKYDSEGHGIVPESAPPAAG